ncbi:uncharacterized protein LOC135813075 [Sycon ciliatum]|uniref:uncharacterized protein LOC135813075 n=1 Tax=Sycon ciliatum TaxID=27933 RepID=UPI0031F6B570
MLSSFAAYLARSVKPGTVANHILAVRNLHLECGMDDPTTGANLLPRVLKGIKRLKGTAPSMTHLPLTSDLIQSVVDRLRNDPTSTPDDRVMLQAAILLMFHSFLRCAEFTASDHATFDPRFDAAGDSVKIAYHVDKPALQFVVKRSKTDPFARGMILNMGPATPQYCPVAAMVEYLSRSKPPLLQPLFRFKSGAPLTRRRFTAKLRALLQLSGVSNVADYGGHSFRISAATTASTNGVPVWKIRPMGRWQSDCVLRYICTDPSDLLSVSMTHHIGPI